MTICPVRFARSASDMTAAGMVGSAFHLLQTLPGMLSVIVAADGGAIGALVALLIGGPPISLVAAAAAGFVVVLTAMQSWGRRAVTTSAPSLEPRFPSAETPGNESRSNEQPR